MKLLLQFVTYVHNYDLFGEVHASDFGWGRYRQQQVGVFNSQSHNSQENHNFHFQRVLYTHIALKEVEGGGWGRGKSGTFVNFSFEFSYLSSVSRSFIEIRIFDIDETLPDIKMDKMLSTSVL